MKRIFALLAVIAMAAVSSSQPQGQTTDSLPIRGHTQSVHVYGTRGKSAPIVLSSGDGGWTHLAPHVAELLAARGFFVIGFDAKAYLESFTSGTATLKMQDVPGDYRLLANFAARGSTEKPILIGVSEGAGLSVLAATDPLNKPVIGGVIGLGVPDLNELGWRLKDSIIYVTHAVPNEPTFSAASIVDKMAPIPFAAIQSTHDEFVPLADVQKILKAASPPKKLWVVEASDHRFSGNIVGFDQRLLEAIQWVKQNQPH